MPPSPLDTLFFLLNSIRAIIGPVWWIVIPVILAAAFLNLWVLYLKLVKLHKMEWVLLSVRVPKEILRTPKAMEQIFAALSAIWPRFSFLDKWWKGKVVEWASFEMVGMNQGIHFYIRIPKDYRNLIEAAVYAQYPSAEIAEAEDYTELLPPLPNRTYDLFGTNYELVKDDVYPIRTYEYFEDMEEERRLDPLAAITEVMSRLKEGEMIWIQVLVRPAANDNKEVLERTVEKLMGKKPGGEAAEALRGALAITAGKRDVIKAIEEKASKLLFETNIRFLYIDHRDSFTRVNVSAITGALQQFNTKHLNALKPTLKTLTLVKWTPFKERRLFMRKHRIFEAYKKRWFAKGRKASPWARGYLMNTEELATIFHFPASVVEAPRLGRLEAKRGSPPPNLPIE